MTITFIPRTLHFGGTSLLCNVSFQNFMYIYLHTYRNAVLLYFFLLYIYILHIFIIYMVLNCTWCSRSYFTEYAYILEVLSIHVDFMLFFSTAAEYSSLCILSLIGGHLGIFLIFTCINNEIFQRDTDMRKFCSRNHKIKPLLILNVLKRFSKEVLVSWKLNAFVSEKHSIFHLHYNFHILSGIKYGHFHSFVW